MKRIKYVLMFVISFFVMGFVYAENISVQAVIGEFQKSGDYTVTSSVDNTSFTVQSGDKTTQYNYSSADNVLSYNIGSGKSVDEVVNNDDILYFIVSLSSNKSTYDSARQQNPTAQKSYGTGCDLTNMGFCYSSDSGNMQVVLSDQFTTYLISLYSGGVIDSDTSRQSVDPTADGSTDSKNPDTGSFTEIGIILGLVVLLLLVVNMKRHSETEFKI